MSLVPFRSELLPSRKDIFNQNFMSLRDEMDDWMNNFLTQSTMSRPRLRSVDFFPAVDIQDKDDKYVLEVEIPGMKEDEIELDLHDNILTLKGERKSEIKEEEEGYYHAERSFGSFRRDIPFSDQVNTDKVKADLKNGILHIDLMKKEKNKENHKKIKIKH